MTVKARCLLLVLCMPAAVGAAEWRMQPAASRLEFSTTSQGSEFKGTFRRFAPRIHFNPSKPGAASFEVSIDIASADTANAERDEALPTPDFFWAEKFPRARFTASACRALPSPGKFACQGTLTLRGKTRKLTFPFAWSGDADSARLTSTVALNRMDFGIGAGDWADAQTIGHVVTVKVELDLRAVPSKPASAPVARKS